MSHEQRRSAQIEALRQALGLPPPGQDKQTNAYQEQRGVDASVWDSKVIQLDHWRALTLYRRPEAPIKPEVKAEKLDETKPERQDYTKAPVAPSQTISSGSYTQVELAAT